MKFKSSSSKGFTLIELLVVVAIISLLSSVVLASLKEAREKAKTKAYRQEVMQLVNALEMYYSKNGHYYDDQSLVYFNDPEGADVSLMQPALAEFIPKLPYRSDFDGQISMYFSQDGLLPGMTCNSTTPPPYMILIDSKVPGFEDWPIEQISGNHRCFSIN